MSAIGKGKGQGREGAGLYLGETWVGEAGGSSIVRGDGGGVVAEEGQEQGTKQPEESWKGGRVRSFSLRGGCLLCGGGRE